MADQKRMPFKYDVPRPLLTRLFLLDLNGDDEPLSGKLMSFNFHQSTDTVGSLLKPISEIIGGVGTTIEELTGSYEYTALSYCWDQSAERHPLWVSTIKPKPNHFSDSVVMDHEPDRNGYLMITTNLRNYLLEYRRRRLRQFLWADAICIDQNSVQDRNNQIPFMRFYYEHASPVHVWLGEATPAEKGALRVMPGIIEKLKLSTGIENSGRRSVEDLLEQLDLPLSESEVWVTLARIFTRPWWSRLWTLQEVVMANYIKQKDDDYLYKSPNVDVFCGDVTIPWYQFDDFYNTLAKNDMKKWFISKSSLPIVYELYGIDAIREIRTCREGNASLGWAVGLSAALVATRRRKATNPPDMVLGMLAMLDRDTIKEMALTVTMSANEVFVRFGKHYIRNEVEECLLNHLATRNRMPGLPSWCPDFASPEETVPIGTRWLGHFEEKSEHVEQMPHAGFQGQGKWSRPKASLWYLKMATNTFRGKGINNSVYNTKNPRQIALVPDTDSILAVGFAIDTVIGVVGCNPAADSPEFMSQHGMMQTLIWDEDCLNLAKEAIPHGEKWLDNYARTITANRVAMEANSITDVVFDHKGQIDFAEGYRYFKEHLLSASASDNESFEEPPFHPAARRFVDCLGPMSRRRRFFATKSGRIGLGPSHTRVGDTLVVIFYCPTPYLLRRNENSWHFVGETYVNGLMYGEVLDMFDRGEVHEMKLTIQ